MCNGSETQAHYTVTLVNADRASGDTNSYTVRWPDALKPGLHKCKLSLMLPSTVGVCVLDMRGPGLTGLNLLSEQRKGYVPVLVYNDGVLAEETCMLDARGQVLTQMSVLHNEQATGATRTDTTEHILKVVLTPL